MNSRTLYLPGLNGLRAIAALSVVLAHTVDRLDQTGSKALISLPLAQYSVDLFFVISGFLITYLLLIEKKTFGINVKSFYIRRMLRIWPLYYFFIAICLCFYQYDAIFYEFTLFKFCLYLFFLPNVPFISSNGVDILNHYWSIGVEEQFYLVWPLIMKIKYKKIVPCILLILIVLLSAKIGSYFLLGKQSIYYKSLSVIRFPSMLVGAIGAFIYYQNRYILMRFMVSMWLQILSWILFFLIGFHLIYVPSVITHELVSILSLLLIFGQIDTKRAVLNLDNPAFNFLGTISYGMYVIHPLVIVLVLSFINKEGTDLFYKNIFIYFLTVSFTVILSYLSYHFIEKPFLRMKERFTTVRSIETPALL